MYPDPLTGESRYIVSFNSVVQIPKPEEELSYMSVVT